jgi:hypothetical protein
MLGSNKQDAGKQRRFEAKKKLALPPRRSRGRWEETLARLSLIPLPPLHLLAAAGRRRQPKAGRGRRRGPSFPLALGARRGPISQSRGGVLTGARRRGGSGDGVATCGGGASSWRQRWSSGGCCNFGRRGRRLRAGDLDRTVADAGMVRPPALAVAGSEAVQLPTVTGGAGQRRRGLGQDLLQYPTPPQVVTYLPIPPNHISMH